MHRVLLRWVIVHTSRALKPKHVQREVAAVCDSVLGVVQHKRECVELLAAFLGIPLEGDLLEVALRQSSKEAMAAALSQYDDHPLKQRSNAASGLPPDAGRGDVRSRPRLPAPRRHAWPHHSTRSMRETAARHMSDVCHWGAPSVCMLHES